MQIIRYLELLGELTRKEIKVRYKSAVFGYAWSVANPLAAAFVFYVAFKLIMRTGIENFSLFLIAGLFPWQWLANSLNVSTITFITNTSLIKRVALPSELLLLAVILNDAVHFLCSVPVVMVFVLIGGQVPSWHWAVGLPLLMASQFLLVYGLALIVGTINVFFRDLQHLVSVTLNLLFYLTPIIYSETMVPAEIQQYLYLNPVAPLIIAYRNLFLHGTIEWHCWMMSLLFGVLALLAGTLIHRRLKWKFVELL